MGGGGACMGCHVSPPPKQEILYETLKFIGYQSISLIHSMGLWTAHPVGYILCTCELLLSIFCVHVNCCSSSEVYSVYVHVNC